MKINQFARGLILLALLSPLNTFAEGSLSDIKLKTSSGSIISVSPSVSGISVYEWFNPECPFVKKIYKNGYAVKLQEEYIAKGIKWYVVSSTNAQHSDFIAEGDREALRAKMNIKNATMIYDPEGKLGMLVGAKTTPHIFIYKDGALAYSGAFDDSPETESDPQDAQNYIRLTLDALLKGAPLEREKTRPYGCSVKY